MNTTSSRPPRLLLYGLFCVASAFLVIWLAYELQVVAADLVPQSLGWWIVNATVGLSYAVAAGSGAVGILFISTLR